MSQITITVPQGIGDVFWVYQKFSPYYNSIRFRLAVTFPDDDLQQRAGKWIGLFPGAILDSFRLVGQAEYDVLATMRVSMTDEPGDDYWYACNRWLEEGTRLDAIDRNRKVAWDVPLDFEFVQPECRYMTVAISGFTHMINTEGFLQVWTIPQWTQFLKSIYELYKLPFYFVGSSFDARALCPVRLALGDIPSRIFINEEPASVLNLIRGSVLHIGYQSGLNILADNMGCKQMMLYFPHLRSMGDSWVKPGRDLFHWTTMDRSVEDALAVLPAL